MCGKMHDAPERKTLFLRSLTNSTCLNSFPQSASYRATRSHVRKLVRGVSSTSIIYGAAKPCFKLVTNCKSDSYLSISS